MFDKRTYLSVVAQYSNLGDLVLRRQAVSLARRLGSALHVYVGNAPEWWIESLHLQDDHVYRSSSAWLRAMLVGPRGRVLLYAPGDFGLTKQDAPRELTHLMVAVCMKATGGKIIRLQRSLRSPRGVSLWLHKWSCRLATRTYWRDERSRDVAGFGALVPDLAWSVSPIHADVARGKIVVSCRGDRAAGLPSLLVEVVRALAEKFSLEPATVSQVTVDNAHNEAIANALGCEHLAWEEPDSEALERTVRELYAQAQIVVTDRLHVMVLAAVEGAVPVCPSKSDNPKIVGTLRLVGLDDLVLDEDDFADLGLHSSLIFVAANANTIARCRDAAVQALVDQAAAIGRDCGVEMAMHR